MTENPNTNEDTKILDEIGDYKYGFHDRDDNYVFKSQRGLNREVVENISRMKTALKAIFPEDASIDEINAADLAGDYPVIRYNSPDGSLQIDILSRLGQAFSFADIQFEKKLYEGVPVRVATPEMLYRMKKDTARLQDRADAAALRELFSLEE